MLIHEAVLLMIFASAGHSASSYTHEQEVEHRRHEQEVERAEHRLQLRTVEDIQFKDVRALPDNTGRYPGSAWYKITQEHEAWKELSAQHVKCGGQYSMASFVYDNGDTEIDVVVFPFTKEFEKEETDTGTGMTVIRRESILFLVHPVQAAGEVTFLTCFHTPDRWSLTETEVDGQPLFQLHSFARGQRSDLQTKVDIFCYPDTTKEEEKMGVPVRWQNTVLRGLKHKENTDDGMFRNKTAMDQLLKNDTYVSWEKQRLADPLSGDYIWHAPEPKDKSVAK